MCTKIRTARVSETFELSNPMRRAQRERAQKEKKKVQGGLIIKAIKSTRLFDEFRMCV